VFCRTLKDAYNIAVYLFKFKEYSSDFSLAIAIACFNNRVFVGLIIDFRNSYLFSIIKEAL
jgi:hypothetical protein